MSSITAQTMDQLPYTLFGSTIGATILPEVPVALSQTSNYILSMSILTSTFGTSVSTINSRLNGKGGNALNQNNVSTIAYFHLDGVSNYNYVITLPPYISVTMSGAPDMIIDAPSTKSPATIDDAPTGSLMASIGERDFIVRGTFDVGSKQTTGTIVGTFALVVNCN